MRAGDFKFAEKEKKVMAYDYIGPYSPEAYGEYYELPYNDQYYEPPWVTIAREGIRRGAETAQIVASGYPSYPNYPTPTPQPIPTPMPAPTPGPGQQTQPTPAPSGGISLSPMTLMLLVGGFLLFTLGKKQGR
jgi:hypothetical protein